MLVADYALPHHRPLHRWERQRRALGAALAAVLLALVLVIYLGIEAHGGTSGGGPDRVTVQPGDTLWSIASTHTGGDVRDEIAGIVAANNLGPNAIQPGQVLIVPAG